MEYDKLYKIVIIGDSSVGKSSILLRYCDGIFNDTYISTIGVDFKIKTLNVFDRIFKIQIWDTAGQERFKAISSSYYRGANGIIIVFDVTDIESFKSINKWVLEISKQCPNTKNIIIVGNKCDENLRLVSYNMAKKFCDDKNYLYFETSAKNNIGVNKLFESFISNIYDTDKFKLIDSNNESIIQDPLGIDDLNSRIQIKNNSKKCCRF